eukprot:TRINITY_DN20579_c0_g1_i1.p1 TRINITY_DN20579_c0_g1~~TRINITY_DN20579_c0_g1_i1.p1  ORF type:complete len:646 (+),score=105.75 TRINITY_DN20579_c0_g1_i1:54-1991(+)
MYLSLRPTRRLSIAVFGANTDVGKTVASGGMIQAMQRMSLNCTYLKPVQTGDTHDADWVKGYCADNLSAKTLYSYKEPCSPHIAARMECDESNIVKDSDLVNEIMKEVTADKNSITLVETAGGVLSPTPEGNSQADAYVNMSKSTPILLIGDPKLGGISCTVSAYESLVTRGYSVPCIVFIGGDDNAAYLRQNPLPTNPVIITCPPIPADNTIPLDNWYSDDAVRSSFKSAFEVCKPGPMIDTEHIWHPYTSMKHPIPAYHVDRASGCSLFLTTGEELIDGMASWWCAIHGYNVPELNNAIHTQTAKMSHVMFGGLTHSPAIELTKQLLPVLPKGLECFFYADSGSVSVEVALKLAVQYHFLGGNKSKTKFLTIKRGYHGDTAGCMSVCDPENGMHSMFSGVVSQQVFVDSIDDIPTVLDRMADEIAAVIVEPIVQGAGGMLFHSPDTLKTLREACTANNTLLIFDEIATGFGRTGKLFASDHAPDYPPDIMCIGKGLTGGYMTLGACISTRHVADRLGEVPLMHGPTFMGNPLACSVALASVKLLLNSPWESRVENISKLLASGLEPAKRSKFVKDVRTLGAIGVIELKEVPKSPTSLQAEFVRRGVWVRPFGKLVYVMPPYVISSSDLKKLTDVMCDIVMEEW